MAVWIKEAEVVVAWDEGAKQHVYLEGDDVMRFGKGHRMPSGWVLARYRTHIGMVFQQFDLFPHKTAIQNVMEGPMMVKGIRRHEARSLAGELLAKVGLSDKEDV